MNIINDKCFGCGICATDCAFRCISIEDGKAVINQAVCIECNHYIAICPKGAVYCDDENSDEVIEYNKETFNVEADNLLNFIKFRRSVRAFEDRDVEVEKIEKIIDAGRFTQTSTNSQDVSYIVIKDDIQTLKVMVLEKLNGMGNYILNNLNEENKPREKYARMWLKLYDEYKNNPNAEDRIYFNAPVLILVVSKTPINGGLASTNMELMTNALGLGTFYSGFTVRGVGGNEKAREFLGLKAGEEVITCLAIGYPKVKYLRTVPRKKANVTWR